MALGRPARSLCEWDRVLQLEAQSAARAVPKVAIMKRDSKRGPKGGGKKGGKGRNSDKPVATREREYAELRAKILGGSADAPAAPATRTVRGPRAAASRCCRAWPRGCLPCLRPRAAAAGNEKPRRSCCRPVRGLGP